jgi:hypothetical protein
LNLEEPIALLELCNGITSRVVIESFFSENFEDVVLNNQKLVDELLYILSDGLQLLINPIYLIKLMIFDNNAINIFPSQA